jgi:ABC-2 type transport system permease protein
MLGHYLVRAVALVLVAVGINLLFVWVPAFSQMRVDITSAQLSSLSDQSRKLVAELDSKRPVQIDAYISPDVPEGYAETRINLLNSLRELDAIGGDKIILREHVTEPLSDEAANADKQFDIKGHPVLSSIRGSRSLDQIYLGVAFTCGLEKVVVPFIDRGVPVEYELVRSIATVSQKERKKVGVLATDARLFGTFNQQTFSMGRNELLIDELEKQYEVKEVRADSPITEEFDVVLAVQPSSLTPEQMDHFLTYVKDGHPTAIFEDPFPLLDPNVPGTSFPKQPPGGMNPFMGGRQPPQPKGNVASLWNMLGIDFKGDDVIWQKYNPYPAWGDMYEEFVFIGHGSGAPEPFNDEHEVSAGLRQMLFLFPGAIRRREASDLTFTPLLYTGEATGTVRAGEVRETNMFGMASGINENRRRWNTGEQYILACHIQGKLKDDLQMYADEPAGDDQQEAETPAEPQKTSTAAQKKPGEVNVVVVSDIDMLYSAFFSIRAQGSDEESDVKLEVDNVAFILNVLDKLAGDERFIEIRKRRPVHPTLVKFETATAAAREKAISAREKFIKAFNDSRDKEQKKLDEEVKKLEGQRDKMDTIEYAQNLAILQQNGQQRLQATIDRLERERDANLKLSQIEYAQETRAQQNKVKFSAVFLPPILPLLMGIVVFFNRSAREREGVSKARLR